MNLKLQNAILDYHRAQAALEALDRPLSAALRDIYGRRAGDMRYRPREWTDRTLRTLGEHYRAASEQFSRAAEALREAERDQREQTERVLRK